MSSHNGTGLRTSASPAPSLPPLFRRIDWLTLLITFGAVWTGYYLTLAPELTLEDSGELATGSYYAGIPHPPGYPVWTLYTWLWTVLVPWKSVAWRVALGEATGGALAAGLLGLLVSRGSSLLMEGIDELRNMVGTWESAICMVSGFVAGMLLGYNGYMWSQSVIVEVYSFSVASFVVVLLCLLRWIYEPRRRRYLYFALFFHGLCFTNHQTLIVAAMGIEVAIAAADSRLGRFLFLGNSIVYFAGLLLKQQHILTALEQNPAVFVIFNVVGLGSVAAYVWFAILTQETLAELALDLSQTLLFLGLAATPVLGWPAMFISAGGLFAFIRFARATRHWGNEWLVVLLCGTAWLLGAAAYFYMPLAGMSNPPMQWGYPRTVEGFIHAFTRGQYEKTNPSDLLHHPGTFLLQLQNLGLGIVEEFNWVYALLALVPFLFFRKMKRRERAWLIGITAIYLCLGVLLLILLNPPADRTAQELNRVFFTASHILVALLVGYGLSLIAAYMATHYQNFRSWGLIGGGVAVAVALYSIAELVERTFFGPSAGVGLATLASFVLQALTDKDQYGLPVYAGLLLILLTLVYLAAVWIYRARAPLAITLLVFSCMPLYSILTHWADNEQRGHWFGYWFGHDMFRPPVKDAGGNSLYPEMTRDAILFGGTDPGRFCPTYMVFCESFLAPDCQPKEDRNFDRRDVYVITQNALADSTYECYLRAQYNRSQQLDPPFFQELFRRKQERELNQKTNVLARAVAPLDTVFARLGDRIEKRRRTYTSWFTAKDFLNLQALAVKLRPNAAQQADPISEFIYAQLSAETRRLLSEAKISDRLARMLAADLNQLLESDLRVTQELAELRQARAAVQQGIARGDQSQSLLRHEEQLAKKVAEVKRQPRLYEPERFKGVTMSEQLLQFLKQDPQGCTRIRLNRLLLEAAYPAEIAKSPGGLYPDREIYIPTPSDSDRCYTTYLSDAARRMERQQLEPGEDVRYVEGKVQISGQVSVMNINGLVAKVIFDKNPDHEFFLEESFPLKWMYPHLTPFGIIMKINRNPVHELSEEVVRKDHEFWSAYSSRLIGNWINYDTPLKEIAAFAERVYLRRNFRGYTGDPRFLRDDQAQKAFSKLRSSLAGMYAWRVNDPENRDPAAQQRMIREADFAYRQAFALCPYSPEAVFRYVNFLLSVQRVDDALLLVTTCQKLDPYNAQVADVIKNLREIKKRQGQINPEALSLAQLERVVRDEPTNFQAAFNLAVAYLQLHNVAKATDVLDRILNHPAAEAQACRALLQAYASISNSNGLNRTMTKLGSLLKTNRADVQAAIGLSEGYQLLLQPAAAIRILDQIIGDSNATPTAVLQVAQQYAALTNYGGVEASLERLSILTPENPDAWYDLAALKAVLGKPTEAMPAITRALTLSDQRLQREPRARDLRVQLGKDARFDSLRHSTQFQQLLPASK